MIRGHFGVSGLVIVLVAGIVSASVYSTDPIWVAGAYDDGDYDTTALAVSSPEALVSPLPPPTSPPSRSTFLSGSEIPRGTSAAEPRGTLATRAPPPA
jgi:hypothetical protein